MKLGDVIECQGIIATVVKVYNNFSCRLVTVNNEIINIFYHENYDYKTFKRL